VEAARYIASHYGYELLIGGPSLMLLSHRPLSAWQRRVSALLLKQKVLRFASTFLLGGRGVGAQSDYAKLSRSTSGGS
jgi:hypothetical protein